MNDFLFKNIKIHLMKCGFSEKNSSRQADKACHYFRERICNSRNPFKECCDYAGAEARLLEPSIKYSSPKNSTTSSGLRGNKKPQEAFNFNG